MMSFLAPAPRGFQRTSTPVPGDTYTSTRPRGYRGFVRRMFRMPKWLKVRGTSSGCRLGNIRGGMLMPSSTQDLGQEQDTVVFQGYGGAGCQDGECTFTDRHFPDFNAAFVRET